MNRNSKSRKKYDSAKALVVKQLASSLKISESYVRMALNDTVKNETGDTIRKEFNRLYREISNLLNK